VALFATGCASTPEQPRLEVTRAPKVERVEVLVTKPCVAVADIPVVPKPTAVNVDKGDTRQLAAAVSVDLKQQDLWIAKASAIIAACAR